MQVLVGWGTVWGAFVFALLSILPLLLLRVRVNNTLARDAQTYQPTREEVSEIFQLQGASDLYASGDFIDANGIRRINWLHRIFVFLNMIKYSLLFGASVGFIIENVLNLFL